MLWNFRETPVPHHVMFLCAFVINLNTQSF